MEVNFWTDFLDLRLIPSTRNLQGNFKFDDEFAVGVMDATCFTTTNRNLN